MNCSHLDAIVGTMNRSSTVTIRWIIVAVGLVLGVVLIANGSVLVGALVAGAAGLRAALLVSTGRRRKAWSQGATGGGGSAGSGSRAARLEQLGRREVGIAAATLGLGADELQRALADGRSIAEVARTRGVAPDTVVAAVVADAAGIIDRNQGAGRGPGRRARPGRPRLTAWATTFVNQTHPAPGNPA